MAETLLAPTEHLTLVEAVDRVLNKGAVIAGDVTISVADVELVRLQLQVVLGAVERFLNLSTSGAEEEKAHDR